jgi:hypothetical protein
VPQGNGIRRSKDLRASFRKFLILTNERKKMSKSTLRKRIALTATTALFAGLLSVASAPVASAHAPVGTTNSETSVGQIAGLAAGSVAAGSLFTATTTNTGSAAVAAIGVTTGACSDANDNALSKGLLYKDSSSGVAQSATVLAGGTLSLYACSATAVAFFTSGGSLSPAGGMTGGTWSYNSDNTKVWSSNITTTAGTAVGALWSAPTTVGTYTVSLYSGFYTNSSGNSVISTATLGATPATLSGNITVSVVAASSGGTYSAGDSYCQAVRGTTAAPASNVDNSGPTSNGVDWSIDLALRDGYGANLSSSGSLIATATNGAKIAWGTAGATPVAGTSSTAITTGSGTASTVRVSQATAGVPITTTVTITWNGTAVCSKTVSIAGTVAAITVPAANIAVQDLSASTGNAKWFAGETRAGTFYVVATDSVGNRLATPSSVGAYAVDGATLGTTVTDVTVPSLATSTSSSSVLSASVGTHACAATAGTQKGVVLKFTLANGTVIKSAPFDLSCGDDPASYTASFDKAKYISGEVATLTVSFKDSKGNNVNNVVATGASTISIPGMTLVSATGAADVVAGAGGALKYTYTVGQTAGNFAGVVDFTAGSLTLAQYAKVQNPSYSISTGGDTTTNADVLKSIVALIASINKQIQALQKLILKR